MDPTACLERCAQAIRDGDKCEAREALTDYWAWRRKEGFEPQNVHGKAGDAFAGDCARAILEMV